MSPTQKTQYTNATSNIKSNDDLKKYIAYRTVLKSEYHHYALLLKVILILGLFIMAVQCRYVNFIEKYPGRFAIEVMVFVIASFVCYLFFRFYRNIPWDGCDVFKNMMILSMMTIMIVVFAELGSLETLFGNENDSSSYTRERLQAEKELPRAMIRTCQILLLFFLFAMIAVWSRYNLNSKFRDRNLQSTIYFVIFIISTAIIAFAVAYTVNIRSMTSLDLKDVSKFEMATALWFFLLYLGLFLHVMYMSIFKVKAVNLFSYLPGKETTWVSLEKIFGTGKDGTNRIRLTMFLFEAFVIAAVTAVVMFLVAFFRDVKKYDDAGKEFGLLFIKIFLFYVILQLTGTFDHANKGFCMDTNFRNIPWKQAATESQSRSQTVSQDFPI